MRTDKNKVAFYTRANNGRYDELVLDFENQCFDFYYDTKECFLYGKGSLEIELEYKQLHRLKDIAEISFNGGYSRGTQLTNKEIRKINGKPKISKEILWQAVRRELGHRDLCDITTDNSCLEKDDYFDYQNFYSAIGDCISGKISFDYFIEWLSLMTRCLKSNNIQDKAISDVYYELADLIDSFLFIHAGMIDYDWLSKRHMGIICRELLARINYANHKIENLKSGSTADFTTNDIITYVSYAFDVNDGYTYFYRVCVVDKKRWCINFMYVKGMEYRKDINYTFVTEADFDRLSHKYQIGFKVDSKMGADYAATKR